MHFIIYKTTNKINGKYYIGMHKTEDINDSYLGSGVILQKAIQKYGKANFDRVILEFCDCQETMQLAESKYVTSDVVNDPDSYNAKLGGQGGWDHLRYSETRNTSISKSMKDQYKLGLRIGWEKAQKTRSQRPPLVHSEKSKRLISENNGNNLEQSVIDNRVRIYENIDKSRGYIGRYADLIGVSHTTARRFINKHIINRS